MENIYFEDKHKAQKAYPYIEPDNVNLSYVVHVHDELEIAFVRSGETTVIGENFMKRALSGDICVFMPGELHGFVPGCWYISTAGFGDICPVGLFVKR